MNPKNINSANIIQFGFSVGINLELRRMTFDASTLSTYKPSMVGNVLGIGFEVRDPAGVLISKIDFDHPHINPSAPALYQLALPSGIALFGTYLIKAQVKESNGDISEIVLPPKKVCQPIGWENGSVPGNFDFKVDCLIPRIRITETTPFAYESLTPSSVTKTGVLYYPQGTGPDVSFTRTPLDQSVVYTGSYVVRNKSVASYDLGDNVSILVAYKTNLEKRVTCQTSVVDLSCCLDEISNEIKMHCNTHRGRMARAKMENAIIPLMLAYSKEKAGLDPSGEISEVQKILGCSCECGTKLIESSPVGLTSSTIFDSGCATSVTPTTENDGLHVAVKTKWVKFQKIDAEDEAIVIEKTEDDCNINYLIGINYDELSTTIINNIKNNVELLQLFNTLYQVNNAGNIDLSGMDGRCVIDLTLADYYAIKTQMPDRAYNVANIIIGTTTFNAPDGLGLIDTAGIQTWLNALGKGVFAVSSQNDGPNVIVSIQSLQNSNKIGLLHIIPIDGDAFESVVFSSTNKTLRQIIQAIFNKICTLKTADVALGQEMRVCYVDGDGKIQSQVFDETKTLREYLVSFADKFCTIVGMVKAQAAITCDNIKNLFKPLPPGGFDLQKDFLLGTKDGTCARLTVAEISKLALTSIKNDEELLLLFCQTVAMCKGTDGSGVCADITAINTVFVPAGPSQHVNIGSVGFANTPSDNQTLTVMKRVCVADGEPANPWVTVTNSAIAAPDGTLSTVVPVTVLFGSSNGCIEVFVKNNACGTGKVRKFTYQSGTPTAFVDVVNRFANATINQVSVANVVKINTDIFAGGDAAMNVIDTVTTPAKLEVTIANIASGTRLYFEVVRLLSVVDSGYFIYGSGNTIVKNNMVMYAADQILIGAANRHLDKANYVGLSGAISGTCTAQGISVQRTSKAVADAVAANVSVVVNILATADNGCSAGASVTFAPGDDVVVAPNINLDCNGNACSDVTVEIVSVV